MTRRTLPQNSEEYDFVNVSVVLNSHSLDF